MSVSRKDTWADGDMYEPYVGRWSRLVAREFLAWLAVPHDGSWLDVGCGTGALTQIILESAAPRSVVGVDPSEGYIAYARNHVTDDRVRFEVEDARSLPCDTASFDAVVSGLVLNFVPGCWQVSPCHGSPQSLLGSQC
jgi:ubiquinone/menaquinone biosynthesis C-methylase UbiE